MAESKMTPSEYVSFAVRTKSPHFDIHAIDSDFLHAVLGLQTETGEIADIAKRVLFYGKGRAAFDVAHVKEEMGDLLWYMAILCDKLEVPFEELFEANIAKLRARYPGKFDAVKAVERDLRAERAAMDGQASS